MKRIICYLTRFSTKFKGKLTVEEMNLAEIKIIKMVQNTNFSIEIQKFQKNKQIEKGNLTALIPFLDEKGIMRVGGRLSNSRLSYNSKHPIILPAITPFKTEADKNSTTYIVNAIINMGSQDNNSWKSTSNQTTIVGKFSNNTYQNSSQI